MYYVVEDFLATVPAATIAIMPEFADKLSAFTTTVSEIRSKSESQTTNRIGYRMVKDDLKLDMTKNAIDVATRVKAYAININDVVLREEMYQRISNLYRRPDTVCADICRYIYGRAKDLVGNLTDYGVTGVMLDTLENSINDYTAYIPKPRAGIVERKQATNEMHGLFTDSDMVLKNMDALVTMLQFSEPEFYATYFSSRKIIRPGYRTVALRGFITDTDGLPLPKVAVIIEDTDITRKSTSSGAFEVKDLASGMYNIVMQKSGYADVRTIVAVTATERTVFSTVMEAESAKGKKVA